jgi:hypothetical protein
VSINPIAPAEIAEQKAEIRTHWYALKFSQNPALFGDIIRVATKKWGSSANSRPVLRQNAHAEACGIVATATMSFRRVVARGRALLSWFHPELRQEVTPGCRNAGGATEKRNESVKRVLLSHF